MDILTFVIGIILAAIISGVIVALFGDLIKKKRLPAAAPDHLTDPQAIEKLKEECELFKEDSFSARLEVQNLTKELAVKQSVYNILSHEYQALKGQLAAIEDMKRQAQEGGEVEINTLKKAKEEIEGQHHKSLEEYEKLKSKFESLEQKCEDFGFHKVAFEKLSEEHKLMRRYLEDLQELHKGDQTAVEELKKKLDSTTEALRAEEQAQENTVKLEVLLEKQLTVQKKRAADFLELEKENKALKEQLKTLQKEQ